MKIRITKKEGWVNEETTWPLGQLLDCDEATAEKIVALGVAENYEPKSGDIIKVSPADGDTGFSQEDLEATMTKVLKENNKTSEKAVADTDEFMKTGGFLNMAEFAYNVFKAETDNGRVPEKMAIWLEKSAEILSKAPSGLSEQVDSDGGFLVPTEFRNTLMQNALQEAIIKPRATVIPMATNSVKIPVVSETTHSGSVFGGVIIYRPHEAGSKTASKPKFGQVELNLSKLVGLVYVTDELLQDSPISMSPLLGRMFAEAIAFQEDSDFINGTGVGQALGILNAPALITQTKEAGQAAASIEPQNLWKMKSRLHPKGWGNAIWLSNAASYPQLRELVVNVGTGGSIVPLYTTDGPTGMNGMLDGFPIKFTEHCQTIGTKGDLYLADWRQYLVGQKAAGLQTATSIHVKFTTDETAFRFVMRYDGQPWEVSPLTPVNGNTTSSFITLAARE